MQAVILAAGKGSRLHPITTKRSKAMLPILGKPIVERVMEALEINGVDDFIVVVSQDDRDIIRYFRRESQVEADVRFVYQPLRLGMADALQRAAPLITGNFILSACDNLIHVDNIARMLSIWQADEHPNAILALIPVAPEQVSGAGIVAMDGDWVIQIIEKPDLDQAPSNIASLPLYCLPREILDYLPEIKISARGEYELQDAIQLLIDRRGHVRGFLVNHRLTLTSPADLLAINRHFLVSGDNQPQLQPQTVGPNTHLITPLHIEGGTRIGENCTIGPNVYIERYCNIGDNTKIKNAILLRGSVIPENTDITDQVVDHLI